MNKQLSNELRNYLGRCGLSVKEIECCTHETRMYHDLGIYGDIAETCMSVLEDYYHVDLSDFEFEKFFPPEFIGKNMFTRSFLWFFPFMGNTIRKHGKYLPLTLRMIEAALKHNRLIC
ncbi:MAG: DUF1493 family protein [Nitrosomonas sp.]|nr:DUF1493 family protein [Nitrosomonas sp.]